jgi:indolepyruvate ferredoxin oxidoreductase
LRGTKFDVFSYSKDRRVDLAIIEDYQKDLQLIKKLKFDKDKELILEILNLPSSIKGFGIVKLKNYDAVSVQRKELLQKLRNSYEAISHAAE